MDCNIDDLITIAEAAELIPGKPHICSVHRWILKGINGVTLKAVRVGGRRFKSREWVREFIDKQMRADSAADDELIRDGC